MATGLIGAAAVLLGLLSLGSLSRSRVWWIRGLDFPRLQFAALGALLTAAALGLLDLGQALSWVLVGGAAACTLFQAAWVLPFTRLHPVEAQCAGDAPAAQRLRILVANVQMENRSAETLLALVRQHRPQLLLALETDAWWERQLDALLPLLPQVLRRPLDHLFHSAEFRLCRMQRLPAFGSDHFPILVELALQPARADAQAAPAPEPGDLAEARQLARAQGVSAAAVHAPGEPARPQPPRGDPR